LLENPRIQIENWLNKRVLYKKYWYAYPIASKLAKKLRLYAFNVVNVKNASKYYTWTVLVQNLSWDYTSTENLLNIFINYRLEKRNLTGNFDIDLILWDDYVE
jgi:hypothetical protein